MFMIRDKLSQIIKIYYVIFYKIPTESERPFLFLELTLIDLNNLKMKILFFIIYSQ